MEFKNDEIKKLKTEMKVKKMKIKDQGAHIKGAELVKDEHELIIKNNKRC